MNNLLLHLTGANAAGDKTLESVTTRSPALRPAGRTDVRSKCSLHFSALFADYKELCASVANNFNVPVIPSRITLRFIRATCVGAASAANGN